MNQSFNAGLNFQESTVIFNINDLAFYYAANLYAFIQYIPRMWCHETYGFDCRAFTSLGYAQAIAVLRNEIIREEAIADCAQGHRNYAKRQLTWFRKDPLIQWLPNFGSDPDTIQLATTLVAAHLRPESSGPTPLRLRR